MNIHTYGHTEKQAVGGLVQEQAFSQAQTQLSAICTPAQAATQAQAPAPCAPTQVQAPAQIFAPAVQAPVQAAAQAGTQTKALPGLSRRRFVALAGGTALACLLPFGLAGCSSGEEASEEAESETTTTSASETNSITTFLFDTYITIEAACSTEVLDQVNERLEYFENTFSRTVEGSDIWNINEAGGAAVEVAEETADIITQAIAFAEETDGLFDISIGAASTLWDFVEGVKADSDELAEAIKHIDYRTISVTGTTVTLADPDAKLDLGGIAKGYIADDIVALLEENGCSQACLSLGGNIYVMGNSFDGDAWNVGIQDPNGEYSDSIASRAATDISIVTSGLYERYFEEDGVTYYHILDPKTGYPVETDLESVSLVCESSTRADVYATVMFLKGHDAAVEFVNNDSHFLDGIFINSDGDITTTDETEFTLLV